MNVPRPRAHRRFERTLPRLLAVAATAVVATVVQTPTARADGDLNDYRQLLEQLDAQQSPASAVTSQPRQAPRAGVLPPATRTSVPITVAAAPRAKTAAPRRGYRHVPTATLQGFVTRPERVMIRGALVPQASAAERSGGGHFLTFPNAEATGAAQGQTVNRAINDLD